MGLDSGAAQFGKVSVDYLIDGDFLLVDRDSKPLGEGGFGVVYRGEYNFVPVAVKELKVRASGLSEVMLQEFQKETELMVSLRSPHVIQVFGACIDSDAYQLVMEYAPKGSLYHVLRQKALSWPQQHRIASGISYGLHYLHSKSVIHRDLKSLNVLMMKDWSAKITDFGLAKVKKETSNCSGVHHGKVGSLLWMAPEIVLAEGKPPYNAATDIFAMAVVFWEILSRRVPFEDAHDSQIASMQAAMMGRREKIPDNTPEFFATLVGQCWAQEANKRPELLDIIKRLRAYDPSVSAPATTDDVLTVLNSPVISPVSRFNDQGGGAEKDTEMLGAASTDGCAMVPIDVRRLTPGDESSCRSAALSSPKPNSTVSTSSVSSLNSGEAYRSVGRDIDSLSGAEGPNYTAQPTGAQSSSPSCVFTAMTGSSTAQAVQPRSDISSESPMTTSSGVSAVTKSKRTQEAKLKKPSKAGSAQTDMFKPPIDLKEVNEVLSLVAEGEQAAAEEKLKKKPQLASHKGRVTDLSERTFKDITVFQYAAWALDVHMWTMILKYLPSQEATQQLNELKRFGTQHGTHADWRPLITSLDKQLEIINNWYDLDAKKKFWQKREHYKDKDDFYGQAESHWCKVVGSHQRNLPVHVVNEYCRRDRSFDPTPTFDEAQLPRTRETDKGEWFIATYNGATLGEKWGAARASGEQCGTPALQVSAYRTLQEGKALLALYSKRIEQLEDLEVRLDKSYTSMSFSAGP